MSSTSRAVRGFPPHFGARLNDLIGLHKCGEESAGAFDWEWEEPLGRECIEISVSESSAILPKKVGPSHVVSRNSTFADTCGCGFPPAGTAAHFADERASEARNRSPDRGEDRIRYAISGWSRQGETSVCDDTHCDADQACSKVSISFPASGPGGRKPLRAAL